LHADSAGNVGVAYGVMTRQMDLASQMDWLAVVLAEEEPGRVEVVEVGFDSPIAPDLHAEALAANAATTSRDLEQELDPLLANRPDKTVIGTDKFDVDHVTNCSQRHS
jgi:hypothetical protein